MAMLFAAIGSVSWVIYLFFTEKCFRVINGAHVFSIECECSFSAFRSMCFLFFSFFFSCLLLVLVLVLVLVLFLLLLLLLLLPSPSFFFIILPGPKLLTKGQPMWPANCFCTAHQLGMVFTFLNGYILRDCMNVYITLILPLGPQSLMMFSI
uniref:Uncharacterized protein n=1 Tax=Rousettus aegyptiacus TaxID=9407 RepID=A0A7J8H1G5_ROUAE|nr:hypothetical protein HJG63_011274 [Rousettus aegyptiacus]